MTRREAFARLFGAAAGAASVGAATRAEAESLTPEALRDIKAHLDAAYRPSTLTIDGREIAKAMRRALESNQGGCLTEMREALGIR